MKYLIILLGLFLAFNLAFAEEVELIFSHKMHSVDVGAGCTDCHALAEESALPADNLLPDMETCYMCHDEEAACTMCHKDPDNAIAYPRIETYIAKFPHELHISNGADCSTCHAGVENSDNIFDSHLPSMANCQTCHGEGLENEEYCLSCHNSDEDLKPFDHRVNWTQSHGITTHFGDESCQSCHVENQCLECHTGDNLDSQVHPLNFLYTHGLKAKGNQENCYTCHEELSFCQDCHQQELVMPRNHNTAGWSNSKTGGTHARVAKFDFDNCLSCHSSNESEPICAQCHN